MELLAGSAGEVGSHSKVSAFRKPQPPFGNRRQVRFKIWDAG